MNTQARRKDGAAAVRAFPYEGLPELEPVCVELNLPRLDSHGRSIAHSAPATSSAAPEDFDHRLSEETRRSFEAGRARGVEEGRIAERSAHLPAEEYRAQQLRRLFDQVAVERDRYLQAVEQETVRLALAIATRILRREAQMDPLLLMGAVRVALGHLAAATEVRLHVPAADADLWMEAIGLIPNPPVRPVVIADEAMRLGDCRLETSVGQVDLGLRSQLGEIERGFFDRIGGAAQPAISAPDRIPAETLP